MNYHGLLHFTTRFLSSDYLFQHFKTESIMSFQISCPSCTTKLKVPQNLIGKQIQCPKCTVSLEVPHQTDNMPEKALIEHPADEGDDSDWNSDDREESPAQQRARIRKQQVDDDIKRFRRDGKPNSVRFRCPYCSSSKTPTTINETSLAGWIVFAAMILVCFPFCFLGWFITEENHYCGYCKKKIN